MWLDATLVSLFKSLSRNDGKVKFFNIKRPSEFLSLLSELTWDILDILAEHANAMGWFNLTSRQRLEEGMVNFHALVGEEGNWPAIKVNST